MKLRIIFSTLFCTFFNANSWHADADLMISNVPPSASSWNTSVKEPVFAYSNYRHTSQKHHQHPMLTSPQTCSNWSYEDYQRAVIQLYGKKMPHHLVDNSYVTIAPHILVSKESLQHLLRQWHLYRHDNFRSFVRALPDYENLFYSVCAAAGADSSLPHEITRIINDEYMRVRQEMFIRGLACIAPKEQISVPVHTEQSFVVVEKDFTDELREYENLIQMYQDYGYAHADRLQKRIEALHPAFAKANDRQATQNYALSNQAAQALENCGYSSNAYLACTGTPIQQVLHQECITLTHTIATSPAGSLANMNGYGLIESVDAAREYNRIGQIKNSLQILDFCWAFVDYSSAILEGAAAGLVGVVHDLAEHPLQTAACVVAGEYVLAYQLSKVVLNVAQIGVHALVDPEQGKREWHDYLAPVTHVINAIQNKEVAMRDTLRGTAAVATGLVAQQKLLGGLGKIYSQAKSNTSLFIQKNPLATPEQYMATSEGVVLKVAGEVNNPAHNVIQYEKLKSCLRIEEFTSIIPTTKHGIQRLIERGFTPEDVIEVIKNTSFTRLQSDGSKAYVKHINNRFNVIVLNERSKEVVTALKNIDEKALKNLGKNYGWTPYE